VGRYRTTEKVNETVSGGGTGITDKYRKGNNTIVELKEKDVQHHSAA